MAVDLLVKHSITIGQCTATALSTLIPVAGGVRYVARMTKFSKTKAELVHNGARTASAETRARTLRFFGDQVMDSFGRTCGAAVELFRAAWAIYRTASETGGVYYSDESLYENRRLLAHNTCTIDIRVGESESTAEQYSNDYNRCFSNY